MKSKIQDLEKKLSQGNTNTDYFIREMLKMLYDYDFDLEQCHQRLMKLEDNGVKGVDAGEIKNDTDQPLWPSLEEEFKKLSPFGVNACQHDVSSHFVVNGIKRCAQCGGEI